MTVRNEAEQGSKRDAVRASQQSKVDGAAQASTKKDSTAAAKRSSPDPHAGTDRYRLATPFSLRL